VTIREELSRLAGAFEGAPPEEIIAAVALRFPGRIALACSFGAEDCVLLDVVARTPLPVEIFTLDTGFLFAETYALWTRLEERYGVRIRPVTADLPSVEPGLAPPWHRDPDACCAARKVAPLQGALAGLAAWVTGIRREQTSDRANAKVIEWDARFGLVKVNPLAGWTSEDVWNHVRAHDVPTSPLHAQGYLSIGCAPCTSPVRPGEDPRAGRWRGREKTECGLHADRARGAKARQDA
jgi:phosphoadenylyl-sulfate reductase (thioredoxin)